MRCHCRRQHQLSGTVATAILDVMPPSSFVHDVHNHCNHRHFYHSICIHSINAAITSDVHMWYLERC